MCGMGRKVTLFRHCLFKRTSALLRLSRRGISSPTSPTGNSALVFRLPAQQHVILRRLFDSREHTSVTLARFILIPAFSVGWMDRWMERKRKQNAWKAKNPAYIVLASHLPV